MCVGFECASSALTRGGWMWVRVGVVWVEKSQTLIKNTELFIRLQITNNFFTPSLQTLTQSLKTPQSSPPPLLFISPPLSLCRVLSLVEQLFLSHLFFSLLCSISGPLPLFGFFFLFVPSLLSLTTLFFTLYLNYDPSSSLYLLRIPPLQT